MSSPSGRLQQDLSGQRIGERYTLLEPIGEGGMGTVYHGRHEALGRSVAIKVLHGDLVDDEESVARFRREALAIARLDHPHIVKVDDFGATPSGALFIVMEHLRGEPLSDLIARRGALPLHRVIEIACQTLDALAAAHAAGIVHRDLTSANIFLDQQSGDGVKLLDFGISKLIGPQGEQPERLTVTGTVLGTPYYLAPEQARGARTTDPRADIYSLGVVLYEMLTGELPFVGRSVVDVLTKHRHEAPVPPRNRRPDLPISAELEQLVLKAMRKDPQERFASATAMRQALDALPSHGARGQSRGRGRLLAAAIVVVVAVLTAAVLLVRQRQPPVHDPSLAPSPIDRPRPVVQRDPDAAARRSPIAPADAAPTAPDARPATRAGRPRGRRRPARVQPTGPQPAARSGEIEDNPYR